MTLPDLLVIRHGETQWNREGRLQGRMDQPLTLNGVRQVMAVAEALRPINAAMAEPAYWVSPLGRARQTASLLADAWSIPFASFRHDPRLMEISYGHWEGSTRAELTAKFPEEIAAYDADAWNLAPSGGEARTELTARLLSWLNALDPARPHIVVSHSGCLRALRGYYTSADTKDILAYREPQTTAFRLTATGEEYLPVPAALLAKAGCEGVGRTVGF